MTIRSPLNVLHRCDQLTELVDKYKLPSLPPLPPKQLNPRLEQRRADLEAYLRMLTKGRSLNSAIIMTTCGHFTLPDLTG